MSAPSIVNASSRGLGRGERAPDFVLPDENGNRVRFYARAGGRPAVLLFYGGLDREELCRFSEALDAGGESGLSLFGVQGGANRTDAAIPFQTFADEQGRVRRAYRLDNDGSAFLLVLDPNLRVVGSVGYSDAGSSAGEARSIARTLPASAEAVEVTAQAPALFVPNVLDPEICQFLIRVWQTRDTAETGVEQSHGARREDALSPETKRRQDHVVVDERLLKMLTSTIGRRVMPEVRRSFAFNATRFEGFKIVCYDSRTGGFFQAHRDNLSPSTAHRRFALTLNLNEAYEGGRLRFPEFGPMLYKPGAGEALIFSCAHLHEVTEVTEGRRFALLSFLFGDPDTRTPKP